MTIQEAYEKVAAVLPSDKSIAIQIDCWWHWFDGKRDEMEAGFLVSYSDGPLYRGNTLEAAVSAFLAAENTPATTVEEVQQVIASIQPLTTANRGENEDE